MNYRNTVFCSLISRQIFTAIFCLVALCFSKAWAFADTIFVAEIPTYLPFKVLDKKDLLKAELKYYCSKRQVDCKALSLTDPEEKNYRIAGEKKGGKNWRGAVKVYGLTDRQKEKEAYNLQRIDSVLNYETDLAGLQKMVDLFEEEAFGETREESRRQANQKMRLVLFANRMQSILSVKNRSLKVPHNQFENALIIRGVWEPKWIDTDKNQVVSARVVRRYMQHCLLRSLSKEIPAQSRLYWRKKADALIELEENIKGNHVPYHELREVLRVNSARDEFIDTFRGFNPGKNLYEATHDSDLVGLRIAADPKALGVPREAPIGLYSHYEHLLEDVANLPAVLTTGHRVVYQPNVFKENTNLFAWLFQVLEEDRYARAAASKVDFRASYISEPNALYLVSPGQNHISHSFLSLPNGDKIRMGKINEYDPCESMAIMLQIYKDTPGAELLFDPTHPVLMKIPERMLRVKTTKTPLVTTELGIFDLQNDRFRVLDRAKVLRLSGQISQSPFFYRDFAINLYRQFGLNGGNYRYQGSRINGAQNVFKTLVASLMKYHDIKEHEFTNGNFKLPSKIAMKTDYTSVENMALKARLNAISRFKTARNQARAIVDILDSVFGNQTGTKIWEISQAMGKARRDHYFSGILRTDDQKYLRTSPKVMIENPFRN